MQLQSRVPKGTLQDASGMDIVEDGTELSAGTYLFTPAEPTGISSNELPCKVSIR